MQPRRLGKYEVTGRLGTGAMGDVYRAHDPVLDRDVAIKVLKGSAGDEATQRFLQEAKAAAQLNHPNIITVHDFGEEGGKAYMAMELVEGRDLREIIEKKEAGSLEDRLAVMDQVLEGMAFAHAHGLVHRDLKPGNVRVLPDGKVKVLDFGLARRTIDASTTETVRGTPYYMAPEQVRSERATERSDVFALGAVFYELLSGRRPFPGATIPAVLYSVVHDEPLPLTDAEAPAVVSAVVARALRKDPDARYADAGEMREALQGAWIPAVEAEAEIQAAELEAPEFDLGPSPAARPGATAEIRAALAEVTQYLDDHVPPLFAADSVVALAALPPVETAIHVLEWARVQRRTAVDVPIAELLFHALYKLSMVGVLNLTEKAPLVQKLRASGELVVDACATADREPFRAALARLGEADAMESALMRRKKPADLPQLKPSTPGLRRLSLLEQRLRRDRRARGPAAVAARRRVASQALALAANEARNGAELAEYLKRLRAVGVPSGSGHVFRSLGEELPDWALSPEGMKEAAEGPPPSEVRAMQQIISLAEDPVEAASRFRHLVTAATQLFNEGNLGRTVRMLQVAGRLATEKKVPAKLVEPVVSKGHEALDPQRLRSYMEKPERHPQLQGVMAFFEAGLGVEALLRQLETEDRRERRRIVLDLLVVHGERARAAARDRLIASVKTPATETGRVSDFARRNWAFLLRTIPRPAGDRPETEVDALAHFSVPGRPGFLVRETVQCLAQSRHPRAAQALAAVLEAWEDEAEHAAEGSPARTEAQATLDKIAAALARQGTPAAWTALLDHGLSRRPELGDTVARLGELGTQDLASAPEVVEAICADLRDGLPRGVLGRLVGRAAVDLPSLVAALGGTRTQAVRAVLDETIRRCSGQEAGRAASRVRESVTGTTAAPAFSGELDRYGLTAVLHRLALTRPTGILQLMPGEGAAPAAIVVAQGRVVSARCGHRQGLDAFYQVFERPIEGTYALEPGRSSAAAPLGEIAPLVREGIKRRAELQRLLAIVPEETPLQPTGEPPGTVEDADYDLVVVLWQKACAGVTAAAMEAELGPDALRIYAPLAQWLEEGSLQPVPPSEPLAPDDDSDEEVTVISPRT
jgi:predicted Ser/Thr protein kinase